MEAREPPKTESKTMGRLLCPEGMWVGDANTMPIPNIGFANSASTSYADVLILRAKLLIKSQNGCFASRILSILEAKQPLKTGSTATGHLSRPKGITLCVCDMSTTLVHNIDFALRREHFAHRYRVLRVRL